MPSLELDRGKHAKRRVAALAVVEDLEVLEDRVGELDAGPPVRSWIRDDVSPTASTAATAYAYPVLPDRGRSDQLVEPTVRK